MQDRVNAPTQVNSVKKNKYNYVFFAENLSKIPNCVHLAGSLLDVMLQQIFTLWSDIFRSEEPEDDYSV